MLKKLKMPKPKSLETDELDLDSKDEMAPESAEEEAVESSEEEAAESPEEEAAEHPGELEAVSDEDLMAEVKKRGLLSQLEKETGDESAEDAYL